MTTDHRLDDLLSGYLDGTLSEDESREVRERMGADPLVRARLAELWAVEQAVEDLRDADLAAQPARSVMPASLRTRLVDSHRRIWRVASWWGGAAAAALLLGVGVAVLIPALAPEPGPTPVPVVEEPTPDPSVEPDTIDTPPEDLLLVLDFLESGIEPEALLALDEEDLDLLQHHQYMDTLVQLDAETTSDEPGDEEDQ